MKPETGAGRGLLRWLSEYVRAIIGAGALAALLLGVVGYGQWVPERRFTEHLYRTLQLFIIFVDPSGSQDRPMPAALEVARFLAPAAATAAGIRAVLARFGQRAAQAWVRFFVRDRVVVVEADASNAAVADARASGAADVGTKLAAVRCHIRPWTDWTGEGLCFSPEEIERRAELEHERWCRERTAAGWTYGPTRDDERKTTPYLVPWDQLTEDVKDYDRNAVRALPELLTYAGLEIARL